MPQSLRVLSWNLFHGRSVPPSRRPLRWEFASALASWEWDVALLQEVPPWWAGPLAEATGAQARVALTSRNQLLALRRVLGERWPEAMRSSGGCNAILARGRAVEAHAIRRLRLRPERRAMHAVRLRGGTWVANLHAQAFSASRAHADHAVARAALERWGRGAPLVVGGDFNLRRFEWPGFERAARHDVDHVLVRGAWSARDGRALGHGPLSDHAPVAVTLERAS